MRLLLGYPIRYFGIMAGKSASFRSFRSRYCIVRGRVEYIREVDAIFISGRRAGVDDLSSRIYHGRNDPLALSAPNGDGRKYPALPLGRRIISPLETSAAWRYWRIWARW